MADGSITKMTEALDISQSPLVKESPPLLEEEEVYDDPDADAEDYL